MSNTAVNITVLGMRIVVGRHVIAILVHVHSKAVARVRKVRQVERRKLRAGEDHVEHLPTLKLALLGKLFQRGEINC